MRIRIIAVLMIAVLLAGTFACGKKDQKDSDASKTSDIIDIIAGTDAGNPAPKGADSVKTLMEKCLEYFHSGCDYSVIADVHDPQAYLALYIMEGLYRGRNLSFAEAMDKAALLFGDADTLSKTDPQLAEAICDEWDTMDPDEYVSEYMNDLRSAMRNGEISESDEHYDRYRKMLADWDKGTAYMLENYPEMTERAEEHALPIGLDGTLKLMQRFARFEFNSNLKRFGTLESEYRPENTFVGEDGICSYDLGKVTEDNDVWDIGMLYYVKDSTYYLIGFRTSVGSIGG